MTVATQSGKSQSLGSSSTSLTLTSLLCSSRMTASLKAKVYMTCTDHVFRWDAQWTRCWHWFVVFPSLIPGALTAFMLFATVVRLPGRCYWKNSNCCCACGGCPGWSFWCILRNAANFFGSPTGNFTPWVGLRLRIVAILLLLCLKCLSFLCHLDMPKLENYGKIRSHLY